MRQRRSPSRLEAKTSLVSRRVPTGRCSGILGEAQHQAGVRVKGADARHVARLVAKGQACAVRPQGRLGSGSGNRVVAAAPRPINPPHYIIVAAGCVLGRIEDAANRRATAGGGRQGGRRRLHAGGGGRSGDAPGSIERTGSQHPTWSHCTCASSRFCATVTILLTESADSYSASARHHCPVPASWSP